MQNSKIYFKKLSTLIVIGMLLGYIFLATVVFHPAWAQSTEIKVVPSNLDSLVGQECIVYINVTYVEDLYAWEFQLNYDPTILDLVSSFIVDGGLNSPTQVFYNLTNEDTGLIWLAVSTTYPTTSGISYTSHAICEIHFQTINTGTSSLTLSGTILSNHQAQAIDHSSSDGSISVGTLDLTVTAIEILNKHANETWTHSIYANDTLANGLDPYYYPVNVTIQNTGTRTATNFKVKLEVYYGATLESWNGQEIDSLAGSSSMEITFSNVFNPEKTGIVGVYSLKATVDSENDVAEDNEENNVMTKNDFMVTIMGDVNRDRTVNILDAVVLALAWAGEPGLPQWNVAADLNHDDIVDVLDDVRIGFNWGKNW